MINSVMYIKYYIRVGQNINFTNVFLFSYILVGLENKDNISTTTHVSPTFPLQSG